MRTGKVVEVVNSPPLVTVEFQERRGGERLRESFQPGTTVINWGSEVRIPRPSHPLSQRLGLPRVGGNRLAP